MEKWQHITRIHHSKYPLLDPKDEGTCYIGNINQDDPSVRTLREKVREELQRFTEKSRLHVYVSVGRTTIHCNLLPHISFVAIQNRLEHVFMDWAPREGYFSEVPACRVTIESTKKTS